MKATIRIIVDLEVQNRRWRRVPFFHVNTYAKAAYEGEMDVGEIAVGHTLLLKIFNQIGTEFIIRGIQKIPDPKTSHVQNLIELYVRTRSTGWQQGFHYHSLQECVARLHGQIREQLAQYGIILLPDCSKVGPEPTYTYLPSMVGAQSFQIESMIT